MKIKSAETLRAALPLVTPFRTVHSHANTRELLLLHITTDVGEGWGECSAFPSAGYSLETLDSAQRALEAMFLPALAHREISEWREVRELLQGWEQFRAATHSIETAVADALLSSLGRPLSDDLGGTQTRIPVGVVVGFESDLETLVSVVASYVADGYARVKVKIRPGWGRAAFELGRIAKEKYGMKLMMGAMVETRLGITAAANVAAALGGVEFPDLDTALLLATDPFSGGYVMSGARLALNSGPGLDVQRH